MAEYRWCQTWANKQVVVMTDNTVTQAVINKGTATNPTMLSLLMELSYLSLQWNFSITAVHINGSRNIIADSISRMHENGSIVSFLCIIRNTFNNYYVPLPVYRLENQICRINNLYILLLRSSNPIPPTDPRRESRLLPLTTLRWRNKIIIPGSSQKVSRFLSAC